MSGAALAANLGGIALFALPGLGLTELLAPARRLRLQHRLGYAYLLGVVAVGGSLFVGSHLFGVPLHRPAIAAATLVPAVLGLAMWVRRRPRRGTERPARLGATPDRGRAWRLLAGMVIAAVCLGPLASAVSRPLQDWDGRIFWSAQAAYMRAAGTVDPPVLTEAQWFVIHPRYPPLLPLAQVAVQEIFGAGADDQFYRALYVAFFAALLLVIHHGALRASGPLPAILASLCVALPRLVSFGSGGATSANADLALAGFYGGALVLLLEERPGRVAGFAAGCLLAGAVMTKNEGELLAAVALLMAASRLLRRRPRLSIAVHRLGWFVAAALPALAATVLLASWRAGIPNRDDEGYFASLRLGELLHGAWTRLLPIVRGAGRLSLEWSEWQGLWLVFVVVLLAGYRALKRRLARLMLLAGAAPLAIGFAAYAVTSRFPILMDETWDRFLLQASVPLAIVFACAIEALDEPPVKPGLAASS